MAAASAPDTCSPQGAWHAVRWRLPSGSATRTLPPHACAIDGSAVEGAAASGSVREAAPAEDSSGSGDNVSDTAQQLTPSADGSALVSDPSAKATASRGFSPRRFPASLFWLIDVYMLPVLCIAMLWAWPWLVDVGLRALIDSLGAEHAVVAAKASEARHALTKLKMMSSRLLVASGCGAVIGLERKDADRPAGLRSMTLVSTGSALYTLACIFGIERGDQARAAAQVCTGVGFIGAGVIAKGGTRDPVRGVTTACAVWVSAALGVAAASGMSFFALYATGIAISVLRISRWYNRFLRSRLAEVFHLGEGDGVRRLTRRRLDGAGGEAGVN